jgi:GNAT superfamily N-acetyltransferase
VVFEIRGSGDPHWPPLLALFHAEFPPETREPDTQLVAEADGGWPLPYRYFVWAEPSVRGFVRFVLLPKTQALFVIHIAVAPDARRRGIGARLLDAVRATAPHAPVVCEVDPEEAMPWWQARGARTVTPTYTQPALRPETEPVPFHLMAIGDVPDPAGWVEAFYREVWDLSPAHPLVRHALAGVNP